MRKFTPTRKSSPCPICDDISGKCRSHIDGEIFLCMVYGDARLGEVVNGFKCVKANSGGNWATFKLDNTAEWTQEQQQEWERHKQQQKQQQQRESQKRKNRSLPAQMRSRLYQRILNHLTLHPDDKADLERRGFTAKEIEQAGFKSVSKNQWLMFTVNNALPGTYFNGHSLICDEGYLCPVRNPQGQIVACQVRLRNPQDGNRYKWLSSKNAVLHLFPEGSKDGELPLSYMKPASKASQIWVVEGTGAKPFLVSNRLGVITIAAAGGQFISSPQLFKEYLEVASRESNTTELIVSPDAGDINNPLVMMRWKETIKLLRKWGYFVKIAWWEQLTKEDCDIDELDDYSQIQFIAPELFYKLKPQALSGAEDNKEPKSTGKQSANNSAENVVPFNQKTYAEKARDAWRKSRKFTAKDIIENPEGWLKWPVPKENTITFIRSGLGTGKTTQVIEWLLQLINEPWRNLGYRNTLLLQFCAKTDKATEEKLGNQDGFQHLHEHNASLFILDPTGKISTCVHSILHFRPEDFDGCNLLLDETVSVIRTLFEDKNIHHHAKVLSRFAEAVKRAKRVICLDGLMNDWTVKYISSLAPEKEVVTVKNVDNRQKPIINFLTGTIDLNEENIKKNDRSPWLELIFEHAPIPAIATDSQIMAEWLDEALSAEGRKVLRIDSKTVPEDYIKEFMSDCDGYIAREKPDALIYTPSAESGLDISIKGYFTHHIAFFFGVLSIDSYLQMLGRIRDDIPKFVWCKEWISNEEGADSRSPFVNTLEQSILSAVKADLTECFSGESSDLKSLILNRITEQINKAHNAHFQTSVQVKAIRNYEKGNLRECLLEAIKSEGYPIRVCTLRSNEEMKGNNKDGVERVKRRNCHDIFTAEKIDIADADFGGTFDARWEERVKVIQANYRKQLPGIEETDSWTEDFIYKIRYENPKFITQNRRHWLLKNSDVALRVQQEQWNWIFHQEEISLSRIRLERALVDALKKLGLQEVIDLDVEWSEENPIIQRITEASQEPQISNALGCHPGKRRPIQWVGCLLGMLGLKFEGTQERQSGSRVRTYRVMGLNDPDRANAQACLTRKYEKYLANEVEEMKWDETLTQQGLESVTPPPESIYKPGGRCDSNTDESKTRGQVDNSSVAAEVSELDLVVAAFAACQSFDDFLCVAADYDAQTIEDAILYQQLPVRYRLSEWYAAVHRDVESCADIIRHAIAGNTPFDVAIAYNVMKGVEADMGRFWSQMEVRIWLLVPVEERERFPSLLKDAQEMGLLNPPDVA